MSCGVGRRHGSDPALLWLWRRPVATAPIQPLACEPPYAAGAAQEKAKRQKKKKKNTEKQLKILWYIHCMNYDVDLTKNHFIYTADDTVRVQSGICE